MKVFNYTIYNDNPYHEILYTGILDRYSPVKGDIDSAIESMSGDEKSRIFHIHWEEHCLRLAPSLTEARSNQQYLLARCRDFQKMGGKIVWTMHNEAPHELEFPDLFKQLRQNIVGLCDQILVHNLESMRVLQTQAAVDPCKVYLLPHASYLGVYEPEDVARTSVAPANPRTIQSFGMVRRYKGLDKLLGMVTPEFTSQHNLNVRISGPVIPSDTYPDELKEQCDGRTDVEFDFRKIPSRDVPELLRSAACVVLPYERFLTSGVAMLSLTIGAVTIAPATRQMLELFPTNTHKLLFDPSKPGDLERAILEAASLDPMERESIKQSYLDRAERFSPTRTGAQLAQIYDRLVA